MVADNTLTIYAGKLVPLAYDRTEASSRRKDIEKALFASGLRVTRMFESGSWTHGTSVAANSDVDYMAVAVGQRPYWPSSALNNAKTAIKGSSWKVSKASVSSPIVSVTYYSAPHFEVAPAWYKEQVNGWNVYWIAGRKDEWVLSAPNAHLAYVNRQNDRLGKKVKPLIRLLKAWKYNVDAPMSSFYLEMRAAEHAASQQSISLDLDLRLIMLRIAAAEVRSMNDPEGIVGRIPACASVEKRKTTLKLLNTAIRNLTDAYEAKTVADHMRYWTAMRNVFGSDYPWPTW